MYTSNDVFTVTSSLSKLKELLGERWFVRVSKACLVNLYKVKAVSNGLNFRLTAEMNNGEKVVISRHYRGSLLASIRQLAKEVIG